MADTFGMIVRLSPLRTLFVLAFFLIFAVAAAGARADTAWVVTEDQARCVLDHVEDYRTKSTRIVLIQVQDCKPATNGLPLQMSDAPATGQAGFNAAALPRIATTQNVTRFDTLISFAREDLACLTLDRVKMEDGVAYLPKTIDCER